ncbi:hypothetical protein ACFQ46_21025 [Kineococcus sp. GCM10028916]|uniref:hypothetical protein n=1 Tax=Kineococcus sp. GCM10028916 TaxID=3273394 RepID=UPI0036296034
MSRIVGIIVGIVITAAGVLFTLQGLDVLGGSGMSGRTLWAVLGPIIAIVGLVLVVRSARRRTARGDLR